MNGAGSSHEMVHMTEAMTHEVWLAGIRQEDRITAFHGTKGGEAGPLGASQAGESLRDWIPGQWRTSGDLQWRRLTKAPACLGKSLLCSVEQGTL